MSYDIEAMKKKIAALSGGNKPAKGASGEKSDRPRLAWAKFGLGQHDLRILPYKDSNGQPVQEVSYYDTRLLSEMRFPAPAQWGAPDPIFDLLTDLKKDYGNKNSWKLFRELRPRERYFVPVLVRGEEDKGPQIWEFNSKMLKELYAIFTHPDYQDEDMTNPQTGYDFTLSVSPTDKTFNGYVVKEYKLQARRKPSPVMQSQVDTDAVLAKIPDLESYFKAGIKTVDQLNEIIESFLANQSEQAAKEADGTETTPSITEAAKAAVPVAAAPVSTSVGKKTKKAIDDAFAGLDEK
jgi:hypothetical protein